jgi:hypothetical protein
MEFSADVAEIGRLLDGWYESRRPFLVPDPPLEVRVGRVGPDDWVEWRMIPSPVAISDVRALESELGAQLPPFYQAFLCCRVVLGLDFGDYELPSILPSDALREVRATMRSPWHQGFLPFGSARGCGDPVCFDLARRAPDGDCEVVVFNHDVIPHHRSIDPGLLRQYAAPIAPTFRRFLTQLLTGDPSIFPPPPPPARSRPNGPLGHRRISRTVQRSSPQS